MNFIVSILTKIGKALGVEFALLAVAAIKAYFARRKRNKEIEASVKGVENISAEIFRLYDLIELEADDSKIAETMEKINVLEKALRTATRRLGNN